MDAISELHYTCFYDSDSDSGIVSVQSTDKNEDGKMASEWFKNLISATHNKYL